MNLKMPILRAGLTMNFFLTAGILAVLFAAGPAPAQVLTDLGSSAPAPGAQDAAQFSTVGNQTAPDGLNYYTDNQSGYSAGEPGQTFITGNNAAGYVLASVSFQTAGLDSYNGIGTPQTYFLHIYSVTGGNVTPLQTNVSANFTFSDGDWLQWNNLSLLLAPNATYAWSFGKTSQAAGGWEALAVASGNPYAGGEIGLIPPAGGAINFGGSHGFDSVFDVGLVLANVAVINQVTISPTNKVFVGTPVAFSANVTGALPLHYQWQFNGGGGFTNIFGANTNTLSLNAAATNTGSYQLILTNNFNAVTSAPIVLTVFTDTNPPVVLRAANIGTTNVEVDFSKVLQAGSATNLANYSFTNGTAFGGAAMAANNSSVVLTVATMTYGSNYKLVLNNIFDQAVPPNSIAANTTLNFTALPYAAQDIGNPSTASSVGVTSNGVNVTSAGYAVGGISDQFNFEYQLRTGNFDVTVCVAGLSPSDLLAQAGLMARTSLDAASPFAAALATPGVNGDFFAARTVTNATATTAGNFPANYPNTWLRLNRVGNVFAGFGSYDGANWTQLGSVTIAMPNQIYLGLAAASHNSSQATTAQFVNYGVTPPNAVLATQINPHESPGPSSRKTGIVFSEIMYKPAARNDGNDVEFIEIYNSNPFFQDISSYQISCADMSYTFPTNTLIPGGAYFVIAASPSGIKNVYGLTNNVFGPYNGSLKKSETLQLVDEQGAVLLTVPYSNLAPWPVAASGTGHSIALANPSYGEADSRAWDISDVVGGSPGQMDGFTPSPLRSVVINEILPHSENSAVPQFIELYNHSTNSADVSGCILTDDFSTNKFVIPNGTVIGPAGFVSFTQSQFNFTLNGAGETLYLIKPDGNRVLDAMQFGAQADGVSYGRWPDGADDFYAFTTSTPGTNNSAILIGDIVINELMYDPITENDDDQYVELYNKGTNAINLVGWQFTSGITFTFPNISIAPRGYLVVARNMTNLSAKYPNLNSANMVGNFTGKLSHNGELVQLSMPQTLYTNTPILVAEDQVTYGVGGRWGEWSGGGGSSLELIDPRANHRLAANWADSDETQKSAWTNIEFTGVLDNGANYDPSIDYAQIGLLDAGECLVDNIEVDGTNGVNYVFNPTFESGTNGWSFQGCMTRSTLENTGYSSSHSLHIRCSDRLWTGVNSCQVSLKTNSLASGQTATLRFKARWLHGWPEPLLRLNGNWLEATAAMPLPTNLGSPGMPNSTYITNAGPALYNITHFPAVPAANQPVSVLANVSDRNGVTNLTLYYRLDPATTYTAVAMKDNGTGGDAIARDGIFSATIPGQAAKQIVAFYISATDSNSVTTRFPALRPGDNELPREGVVMFGDGNAGGSFGVYHLWLTQQNINRWAALSDLSNEGNDCTFVYANRVFYNMQGRFAGSPYHQEFDTPNNSLCHYKWEFNPDDQFLGATDFNKIHQPGNGPGDDGTLQREETANTFLRALKVPWLYKRLVAVYVNGNRRGSLMEDTQTPGSDMVKEYFSGDTTGYLYKMQPWFEFPPFPTGSTINFNMNEWVTLNNYTTTGGAKKTSRYRYHYEIRRTADSDNNFAPVYSLIDAANSFGSSNYIANLENVADMENWMRVFAANHVAANRDSFGATTEQNLYGYAGTQGTKYSLFMFDFNICLDHGAWGPGQNLFLVNSDDPFLADIYATPIFRRMYWRALEELVNGPLNLSNTAPLCLAKYNAFVENGLGVENPNSSMLPWIGSARTSIAAQLGAVDAANFAVNPSVTISNNIAWITGKAPINVDFIWINGTTYPASWTTLTNWLVAFPLASGTNNLTVVGVNRDGQPIAGDSGNVSAIYNGTNGVVPLDFVNYTSGLIYTQNFDSLPNPGATSVNANNPVTINSATYSLANPFGFWQSPTNSGAGGLGISALAGWNGTGVSTAQFGATDGDQTTGGNLSFGLPNSSNRALGLLATSSTKGTAFGVKFVNGTPTTLSRMNLQFIGEVWRQSNLPKTLQFFYCVDPNGTNNFPATPTAFVPTLNVNLPTVSADTGGVAVDGTSALNQTNLSVANLAITNWTPGAALWLVWQMTDFTGKAQGLGIDNVSFSATVTPPAVSAQNSGTNILLNWTGIAGENYQLQYKTNLTDAVWTPIGNPISGTGALTITNNLGASPQGFYRLQLSN
jgi:regulation of enolase protein 1 (concanavalin A-like superfamily)